MTFYSMIMEMFTLYSHTDNIFFFVSEWIVVWKFIFNILLDIYETLHFYFWYLSIQVCDQCANVKYVREGYFVTVDIEKGMQDGQVNI